MRQRPLNEGFRGDTIAVRLIRKGAGHEGLPLRATQRKPKPNRGNTVIYDFYLQDQRIGELDLVIPGKEGREYPIPYQGEIRNFVVERVTPTGDRMRADVRLVPKQMASS